jgi:uncharacterized protein (TIRG00374 family)
LVALEIGHDEGMTGPDGGGDPGRREPQRKRRFPYRRVIFLALAAIGIYFVWPNVVAVFSELPALKSITWFWFVLAALLEVASFACYWGLLKVTANVDSWFVSATTQLASNAFSRIVPGGAASGGSMSYQMLTAAGAPRARVFTALTATALLSNAVLLALPVLSIPAILSGAPVDRTLLHAAQIGGIVFALIVGVGGLLLFTDGPLELVGHILQGVRNRARRRRTPIANMPATLIYERDLIRSVIGRRWWEALLFAAGNWLFDLGALLAALGATGAKPHASLVLIAYVVAALLGMIPFTPGGLGFVEVGLAATLQLAGISAADALLATLAYRLVSYWLPIPAGVVAYALFRSRYGSNGSNGGRLDVGRGAGGA